MKVAYNSDYGVFELSPLAATEYQRKKGIELTWYERIHSGSETRYKKIPDISTFLPDPQRVWIFYDLYPSDSDLGDDVVGLHRSEFCKRHWCSPENRADPDLIEVIERLREKADGDFADIRIAVIPDGARFEIIEYDGLEEVVPPRMSWSDAIG